jgi:hypothetical protein
MKSKNPKKNEKTREEERTNSALPIQYNVVIVCEGGKKDREEFGPLFTSTSPRHPVVPHGLVLHIREAFEPTISFEIVAHVLEVRRSDIQNGPVMHKHLDEELASLHKFSTLDLGKKMKEIGYK